MALQLRELTDDEVTTITRLAQLRTAPARVVERARIIVSAHQGARAPAVAARLGLHEATMAMQAVQGWTPARRQREIIRY